MKRFLCMLLIGLMLLGMSGCGSASKQQSESGGLTMALSKEPASMLPWASNDTGTPIYLTQIYDQLLTFDGEMELVPCLAERWEVVDDTHYRFFLRQGVTFHNGAPLTAEDVLYSFARSSSSEAAASVVGPVDIENSYAEDDYTVVLALSEPYPAFLNACASSLTGIVCKSTMEADPEGYASHPIGTGPFRFEEWKSGDYVRLSANEDWWGGPLQVKELTFRYIPEDTTRGVEVQAGGVDVAVVTATDAVSLQNDPNVQLLEQPILNTSYLSFNCSLAPFDDARVRQAVSLAIDADTLVRVSQFGLGRTAKSFLSSATEGYYEAHSPYAGYDPVQARALLAEAGYPDGFACTLISNGRQTDCELIQAFLSEIGIDVELQITDFSTWLDAVINGKQQMYLGGWTLTTGDPSEAFAAFDSSLFGSGGNRSYYSDRAADALINVIITETDTDKRLQACKELQELLASECVTIGLNEGLNYYAVRQGIEGFYVLPTQNPVFTEVVFQ